VQDPGTPGAWPLATTLSDPETLEDFVTGLAFLGTGGGGGRVEDGLDLLAPLVRAGRAITLVDPDELAPDTWTCSVITLIGREPDTSPPAAELAGYGLIEERLSLAERMVEAVRELAALRGVSPGALVSMELGSGVTIATIVTGMALGIPTLDSDYVGRAIPEASQTKMTLHGRSPNPMVFVDRWGNVTIARSTVSPLMADRIGRMVSVAAYGKGLGTATHLVQVRDARPALVRGSLLTSVRIGRALRQGRHGGDRLAPLIEATGGRTLFTGDIVAVDWDTDAAYTFRLFTYRIEGTGAFAGQTCRVWVKNEHHVVWRAETVVGTSPDILVLLDAETNRPLSTRHDAAPGRKVVVFGMPALDPEWLTPAGLALLGPRHFGFDFDHVPLGAPAG
jgi:DUF917 family protein